jgi:hypothetical protein
MYHQSLSTVSFFLSQHWITFLFLLAGADKAHRIQRPKSAKAESCTRKCVSTCIRGGAGAPGEGPLNVRRYMNLCCPSYQLHFIGVKLLFLLIYLLDISPHGPFSLFGNQAIFGMALFPLLLKCIQWLKTIMKTVQEIWLQCGAGHWLFSRKVSGVANTGMDLHTLT